MSADDAHSNANDRSFHFFTPPPPERPNPEVAPFQPSSSSLSAALSHFPRFIQPALSIVNTPELTQDTLDDMTDFSPLSQLPDMNDVLMSPDDSPYEPQLRPDVAHAPYEDPFFFPIADGWQDISPITHPREIDDVFQGMWKMRETEEIELDSPRSVLDGLVNFPDNFSSPLTTPYSTPFFHSNPLSPMSSPNPVSFIDLPNAELPSNGSLLFSPTIHPRRPTKKIASRKFKIPMKVPMIPRLSSSLPLSSE